MIVIATLGLLSLTVVAAIILVTALVVILAMLISMRKDLAKGVQAKNGESAQREAGGASGKLLFEDNPRLYQRWYLELRLIEESARCLRYGFSMALIVVRLDGLIERPSANENGTNDAGLAAFITAVRAVDLTAIVGPNEFAIFLTPCNREEAAAVKTRLEQALKPYKPSAGVVVFPEERAEAKFLLELVRARANKVSGQGTA